MGGTAFIASPASSPAAARHKPRPAAIPFDPFLFHNHYSRCYHLPPPYPDGKNHCTSQGKLGGDPGNDYWMDSGTNVYAIFNGKVSCENDGSQNWGLRAFLHLTNGWTIGYGHLSQMVVVSSDCKGKPVSVKAGHLIAKSGNSGLSSGAHIEVQLMDPDTSVGKDGQGLVDPRALLFKLYRVNGDRAAGGAISGAHGCSIWSYEFSTRTWEAKYEGFPMANPPPCPH